MVRRVWVVVLVMLLCVSPATADERAVRDSHDADGPLDIVSVSHGHKITRSGAERLVHTVYTAEPWRSQVLRNNSRRSGQIRILFDTRQDVGYDDYSGVTEREAVIDFKNGRLRATLYNHLGDPPKRVARLRVTRPARAVVRVFIPRRALKSGELDYYEWGVTSYLSLPRNRDSEGSPRCEETDPCTDYAPDRKRGYVRHDL